MTIRYRHVIHYGSIITLATHCKVAKILILIILLADGLFFGHLSLMIKTWTERRRNSSTYNEQEFIENPKNPTSKNPCLSDTSRLEVQARYPIRAPKTKSVLRKPTNINLKTRLLSGKLSHYFNYIHTNVKGHWIG